MINVEKIKKIASAKKDKETLKSNLENSYKLGTYIILYKEVLGLDIDERELKICCNHYD